MTLNSTAPVSPLAALLAAALLLCTGCSNSPTLSNPDDSQTTSPGDATQDSNTQQTTLTDKTDRTSPVTPEELKRQLNCWQAEFRMQGTDITEASLYQSGIRNIAPLKGLPLIAIDLGMTQVTDLSPLAGMQLQKLDLENTPVADISILRDMPLTVLKMQKTKISDFAVLEQMPLQQLNLLDLPFNNSHLALLKNAPLETLWLAGTQVTELHAIPLDKLESLDIARTAVSSLAPLTAATRLKRLNITDTPIADLTPLANLRLQRITLTPERITQGFDALRKMPSLTQIQTDIAEPLSAEDFWKRFDQGLYQPQTTQPQEPK